MSNYKRSIIALGCDPVRANFAKKTWEPRLGVNMDAAHDIKSLMNMVSSKEYAVFYIAPGMCSLLGEDGREKVFAQVKQIQPNIKCVLVQDISKMPSILSKALGLEGIKDVQPMTEDWPFVD